MLIKAVLFDLDLTLLDRDASVRKFAAAQHLRLHCLSHIPMDTYVSRFIELDERGYVWKDKVYQRLIVEFGIAGMTWEELLEDYISEFHKSCIPYPNLIEMLDRLKRENYKLGLITNAVGDFQFRNIQAIGIDPYFEAILISGWEGIRKPDPEIFLRALKKLGVEAGESVYIGDHPVNDVQAARNAGMKGIWKKDSQWETPQDVDGIISDLSEVPDLIRAFDQSGVRIADNEQIVRTIRYGSTEPLPQRRLLRAGPLTAVLEDGGLRYIRYGSQEVVRGIYAAVRDRNWGTIKPVFRGFEVSEGSDSFEVRFVAEHRQDDIDFVWDGSIKGSRDGTISFTFDGAARSSFLKNRIGFCVLHPAELAGAQAEVETAAGTMAGRFPDRISPHQPFKEMTGIRYEIQPGLMAELRFGGELFEMEDQRNWTDASYKTYCTPLRLPYPVNMRQGQQVRQTVTLRLIGEGISAGHPESVSSEVNRPLQVELEDRSAGRIPQIGLAVTPGHMIKPDETEALRALRLSFLRATIRLNVPGWERELGYAAEAARTLGIGLELETVGCEDNGQLKALIRSFAENQIPLEALFAFSSSEYVSNRDIISTLITLRDEAKLTFRIGGGTRGYFAEFNRAELPIDRMEAAMYTINPQVHAFDLSSMAETVSAQADTVRSARAIIGALPLSIGPITFKPRLNPDAASEEAVRRSQDRSSHLDPRQQSLFGACWTLGSLRSLAEARAERACYFETAGPLGVMPEGGGTAPYPLYHVLAALAPLEGAELLVCRVEDRLSCDALAIRRGDGGITMLFVNYTDEIKRIRVQAPMFQPARFRVLDERGMQLADRGGERFPQLQELPVPAVENGWFELELFPFAFAATEGEGIR